MKLNTGETLFIVMPAYNEAENIKDVVDAWYSCLSGKSKSSRLVVADSGSTDRTHEILLKLKKSYPKLEILSTTNKQHGPKVLALYRYAIKHRADYIFQTDSDGQTDPNEFDAFWQLRHSYDGILGYRDSRGDGVARVFVEKIVCLLLRLFFDVRVPDANAPFRLMKIAIVSKYIDRFPDDYAIPNIIFTAYFARFQEKISFKKISFKPRIAGTGSINVKKIFNIGKQALLDFIGFRKDMKKTDKGLARKLFFHKLITFGILIIFGLAALFIVTESPSHPWNRSEPATDSGVFLTIGKQMQSGLLPYRDTFDHKGPLQFIINYLGASINASSGIIIFECLAVFATFIALYKIARLKCPRRSLAVAVTFIAMSLFAFFYHTEKGNLVEEYAMPLISIALFVFLDYLLNRHTSTLKVILTGACFAGASLLRINMVVVWAVFCLAIFVNLIIQKSFKDLRGFILKFLLGAALIIAPVLIWLLSNGIFNDFIDAYFLFNFTYSDSANGIASILSVVIYFSSQVTIIMALLFSLVMLRGQTKHIAIAYIICLTASILAASMSGRLYPHYGIILVPLIVFPLASLIDNILNIDKKSYLASGLIVLVVLQTYAPWTTLINTAITTFTNRNSGMSVSESLSKACEIIGNNTSPKDQISVYGNRDAIYFRCGRLPATKYSYQYPIGVVRSDILDDYFSELEEKLPKILFVQAGHNDDRILKFTQENNYKLEWKEEIDDGSRIYSRLD